MPEVPATPEKPHTTVERVALAVCRFVNEKAGPKRAQALYHRVFGDRVVKASVGRRVHVDGLEHATGLHPDRGVLLCSNHRSFFDQYVLMSLLYNTASWPRRVYFPVRSNYFYEAWSGLFLNGLIGGFVMYPPIFRDASRSAENRDTMERLADTLAEPGVLVGMHPEGTRGKGPDPYALLPAQPGVGQIVMRARPIVLPAFINGMGNDVAREVYDNYRRPEERPIHIVFGPPVDFGQLLEAKPRPAQYKRVADHLLAAIARLGERERELRER